jgi:hypothetical protein
VVRPAVDPLFWTLHVGQGALVRSSRGGEPFTLRPLPLDGVAHVGALDLSGQIFEAAVPIQPGEARPHLVLNEVMANPAGAEPSEEWVELYNDGIDAVSVGGFVLQDSAGRTVLPDATLDPASFALIVPESFVADDGVDPPPRGGTLLVRVPALGRGGLSNEGETLTLISTEGKVISTFPAMKTKNGISNARVLPDAPDTGAASFGPSTNGSATPGASNFAP